MFQVYIKNLDSGEVIFDLEAQGMLGVIVGQHEGCAIAYSDGMLPKEIVDMVDETNKLCYEILNDVLDITTKGEKTNEHNSEH